MKKMTYLLGGLIGIIVIAGAAFAYLLFWQPAQRGSEKERFIIPLKSNQTVGSLLKSQGFINNIFIFNLAVSLRGGAEPGGYYISKSESAWQIASKLAGEPSMKWVVLPEGLRKEQMAEVLAKNLGWSESAKINWVNIDTAPDADHSEGVYFPDTYLIPTDEPTADVAKRLRARFEEKFNPYTKEAAAQNVRWTTLLKVASIVQREAAGKNDMPMVAGIIWNRLLKKMKLEVDATLQYARDSKLFESGLPRASSEPGEEQVEWWAPITPAEKQIDSPYNTYRRSGLPPRPISNPGIAAIEAALRPASTSCFYYLHDKSGQIHCSDTFEGHKQNIENYLK